MEDVVGKTVNLINELEEITHGSWLQITLDTEGNKSVHVTLAKSFLSLFNTFDIEERASSIYPYSAFTQVEGVKFYTLLTIAEHKDIIDKSA